MYQIFCQEWVSLNLCVRVVRRDTMVPVLNQIRLGGARAVQGITQQVLARGPNQELKGNVHYVRRNIQRVPTALKRKSPRSAQAVGKACTWCLPGNN